MTTAAEVDKVPVAAAKDVISSIFGSAACVYTGQVSFPRFVPDLPVMSDESRVQGVPGL